MPAGRIATLGATMDLHDGRLAEPPPLRLHGSVEPVRSHAIVVPRLSGSAAGPLVIVRLVKPGAAVKRGDVLIEFDRQTQIKTAHDREAEYRDFVEQINKKGGEQLTGAAHDEAEVKTAGNAVKSAELEMLKNEMAPAITAEQNRLSLDEARVRLQQLRRTFDLKRRADAAELQWFNVIGIAGPQAAAQGDVAGVPGQDRNNLVYVPTASAMLRLEDTYSQFRDEIDGLYIRLKPDADVTAAAATVRGILSASHRGAEDYSLIVPAELLAEQQRTKRIFDIVMVALASISLLVGGIGIMNIMLASVLERTPEIGLRRAIGARQADIVRQFVIETTLIAVGGGTLGLLLGVAMSRLIASFAGWSTIVTGGSLLLAFSVSVMIGLIFGVYPATKAARLDPVQALHYE